MAQATVNFRIDEDLKNQFDKFCDEVGLTATTAYCMFVKKVVREQRIPFDIAVDPFYSETNLEHLRRGVKALDAGEGKEHDLIEVD